MSIDDDKLKRFAERYRGKQKQEMIGLVSKGRQFAAILKTPVGHEILSEVQEQWAFLLSKTINGENTEEDRIRFIVLDSLISSWSKKIAAYYEASGNMEIYLNSLED